MHSTEAASRDKAFATLQALAALHGVSAVASTTDTDAPCIVLTIAAFTVTVPNVSAAEAWLDQFLQDRAIVLAQPEERTR